MTTILVLQARVQEVLQTLLTELIFETDVLAVALHLEAGLMMAAGIIRIPNTQLTGRFALH